MAYTALQLITRSYFLSQIVSRELQTLSGDQVSDGLYLLNALLDFKGTDLRLIPYFQRSTFPTIAGTEEYYRPNLLYVDSMTFNIGVTRFAMIEKTRDEYFAVPRVDDIQSLPVNYRVERELGGSRIFMYPLPADVYQIKISGKFGLTDVTLQTDMSLTYDTYYIEYLRYALAEYICSEYGSTFPDKAQMKLDEIEKKLMDVSPADLSIRKSSYFGGMPGIDWQSVNLWKGYWPY